MTRFVFPSYDRDDICIVNQIMNLPNIVDRDSIGFFKGVDDETLKKDDALIKKWIQEQMHRCSCLILFCGEETYKSKWVKYELGLANKRKMGRFIVDLDDMYCINRKRYINKGLDPYQHHEMYAPRSVSYSIKRYSWKHNNGLENLKLWIEDACTRAGR